MPTLVVGRDGELVDFAMPLSFSLLEKIYGQKGPYRKILKDFGVPVISDPRSFLVNINGVVHNDLDIENQILWNNFPGHLKSMDKLAVFEYKLKEGKIWYQLQNFLKKYFKEVDITALNSHKYLADAQERYETFSWKTYKIALDGKVRVSTFLKAYESVVFVSYLFGVFEQLFQRSNNIADSVGETYINEYDYLGGNLSQTIEKEFSLRADFKLENVKIDAGMEKNAKHEKGIWIPSMIPFPISVKGSGNQALTLLQILKNNLRLKTAVWLYFLGKQLKEKAHQFDLDAYFSELTIDELNELNHLNRDMIKTSAEIRKKHLKHGFWDAEGANEPNKTEWKGVACSEGVVQGRVQKVTDEKVKVHEAVLYFPNASPRYTALFRRAQGLIFKSGSALSHGSIVAREMKIPAIVLDLGKFPIEGKSVVLNGSRGSLKLTVGTEGFEPPTTAM